MGDDCTWGVGRLANAAVGVAMCAVLLGGCLSAGSSSGIAPGAGTSGSPSATLPSSTPAASTPVASRSAGGGTAPCLSATNPGELCGGGQAASPPARPGTLSPPPPLPAPIATPGGSPSTAGAPTPLPIRSGASPVVVTAAENGTTLHLAVGQQFLLDLGSSMDWTVTVADQRIVSRVIGVLVIQGAQGIYAARTPGTTDLSAVGSPPCASGGACPLFRLGFHLTIVVA